MIFGFYTFGAELMLLLHILMIFSTLIFEITL